MRTRQKRGDPAGKDLLGSKDARPQVACSFLLPKAILETLGRKLLCPVLVSSAHDTVTQWRSRPSWGYCSGPLFPSHHKELNGFSFVFLLFASTLVTWVTWEVVGLLVGRTNSTAIREPL